MTEIDDRLNTYLTEVRDLIAEHGWMVQGVFPTETSPGAPFAYTIGLTAAGLPELVIAGLPAETAGAILNTAARHHLTDEIKPGAVLDDLASVPFRVVAAPSAEIQQARNIYPAAGVRAVQLVWPDDAGAFPGDGGWSLGDAQPIYDGSQS